MTERYVSDPLDLPAREPGFYRADLIFYGVDHSASSYEARVYLDLPDADADTGREHPAYAGSFHIFGHGGCFGDEGHCLVPEGPPDPFDLRPAHQLTPATKTVTVTEALKRVLDADGAREQVTVTVVAVTPGDRANDVLAFTRLRLATYE
jgi:hypothetical protein